MTKSVATVSKLVGQEDYNGRVVIDRAIPQIAKLLSKPHGIGFMITVDDNLPEDLEKQFHSLGLRMEPWVRRRARNEYLTVQKITWIDEKITMR